MTNRRLAAAGCAIAGIVVISVFSSCSTQKLMVAEMTGLMEAGAVALEGDDDLDMLQQAMPANIKLMEALLASDPHNQRLLILLARMYGSYAFLMLDGEIEALQPAETQPAALKENAVRSYTKGLRYALRALEIDHPGAADRLGQVTESASFVQSLQMRDLAALFWYGFNLSGLINHNRDSIAAVARGHQVEKSMRRVLELQPDFYYGSAHLVLMVYHASRSPLMGGNLGLAREHYEQLKALNDGGLLLADLYYARYYLVQQQDRGQFQQVLATIIDSYSPDSDPRFRLLNRVARDRALVYQAMVDRLFEES